MHGRAGIVAIIAAIAVVAMLSAASASEKMMSPEQRQKMAACERQADQQHIRMSERAKFLMACMTAAKK